MIIVKHDCGAIFTLLSIPNKNDYEPTQKLGTPEEPYIECPNCKTPIHISRLDDLEDTETFNWPKGLCAYRIPDNAKLSVVFEA